jgi:hypothetical protein
LPSLRPEAPLFPLPLLELSRLGAESFSLAVPRQERTEQQPAGTEQPERGCLELAVGLGKGLEAGSVSNLKSKAAECDNRMN